MGEVPPPQLGRMLSYPSLDDISKICFSNYSDHLLVASFDGKLRLYDLSADVLKGQVAHDAALLDCCFLDDSSGFTASMKKNVCRCDFERSQNVSLGTHDAPVSCVEYSHATGLVVTGSWDKTMRTWDVRVATRVGIYQHPERVCSMSLTEHRLVVATEGRDITIYDLRCMRQTGQRRESSLQCSTRCVRCYPDGYALSSEEGRVAVEHFDMSETGHAKKFKFRTEPVDGRVYSVNAIAFHPVYCTFATGCFAGQVNVWDGKRTKPIYKFSRYPTSVASLSFSRDGLLLAVASSYTYEEGDIPHEHAAIFVRSVNEAEVKAKP